MFIRHNRKTQIHKAVKLFVCYTNCLSYHYAFPFSLQGHWKYKRLTVWNVILKEIEKLSFIWMWFMTTQPQIALEQWFFAQPHIVASVPSSVWVLYALRYCEMMYYKSLNVFSAKRYFHLKKTFTKLNTIIRLCSFRALTTPHNPLLKSFQSSPISNLSMHVIACSFFEVMQSKKEMHEM